MIRGPPGVSSQKGSASVLRAILHKKKKKKEREKINWILLGPADSWLSPTERQELWKIQLKVKWYKGQTWQEAETLRLKGSLARGILWTEMLIWYQIQAAWIYKRSDYLKILKSEMNNDNEEDLCYTVKPTRLIWRIIQQINQKLIQKFHNDMHYEFAD